MVKQTRLTVEIDAELKREAKTKACAEGRTLRELIVYLLQKYLAQ